MLKAIFLAFKSGLLVLFAYLYIFNLWGVVAPFFINYFPPPDTAETERFKQFVTERLTDMVDADKIKEIENEKIRSDAQKLADLLKGFDLTYRELLHVIKSEYNGTPAELRIYQIKKKDQFGLLHLKFQDIQNKLYLVRLDFYPAPQDIHQIRTVLLSRFSATHGIMWLLILLTLAAGIHCVYLLARRRLNVHVGWFLLLFLNLICLKLEWASGTLDYHLLNINIAPFGFSQFDFNPWTLRLNLPLGLVGFLHQYYKYGIQPVYSAPKPRTTAGKT